MNFHSLIKSVEEIIILVGMLSGLKQIFYRFLESTNYKNAAFMGTTVGIFSQGFQTQEGSSTTKKILSPEQVRSYFRYRTDALRLVPIWSLNLGEDMRANSKPCLIQLKTCMISLASRTQTSCTAFQTARRHSTTLSIVWKSFRRRNLSTSNWIERRWLTGRCSRKLSLLRGPQPIDQSLWETNRSFCLRKTSRLSE